MKELNVDFVAEVASKLEPVFQFTNHTWSDDEYTPSAEEIAKVIGELYEGGQERGFPIGTGGIWLDYDGDDLVIEYRQSIEFRWEKGQVFMA